MIRFVLVFTLLFILAPFLDAGCGKGRMSRRAERRMNRGYVTHYSVSRMSASCQSCAPTAPSQAPKLKK